MGVVIGFFLTEGLPFRPAFKLRALIRARLVQDDAQQKRLCHLVPHRIQHERKGLIQEAIRDVQQSRAKSISQAPRLVREVQPGWTWFHTSK